MYDRSIRYSTLKLFAHEKEKVVSFLARSSSVSRNSGNTYIKIFSTTSVQIFLRRPLYIHTTRKSKLLDGCSYDTRRSIPSCRFDRSSYYLAVRFSETSLSWSNDSRHSSRCYNRMTSCIYICISLAKDAKEQVQVTRETVEKVREANHVE